LFHLSAIAHVFCSTTMLLDAVLGDSVTLQLLDVCENTWEEAWALFPDIIQR